MTGTLKWADFFSDSKRTLGDYRHSQLRRAHHRSAHAFEFASENSETVLRAMLKPSVALLAYLQRQNHLLAGPTAIAWTIHGIMTS
jgi:hypothetical protein